MEGGLLGSLVEMLANVLTSFKSAVFFLEENAVCFPQFQIKSYIWKQSYFSLSLLDISGKRGCSFQ